MNGQDVSRMDHSDVVTLIKASGTTITLEVQQPQGVEGCGCVLFVGHCVHVYSVCVYL